MTREPSKCDPQRVGSPLNLGRGNVRIRFGRDDRVFLFKHIISDEKASLCDLFIQVSLVSLSSGEAKMSNLTILFQASTIA